MVRSKASCVGFIFQQCLPHYVFKIAGIIAGHHVQSNVLLISIIDLSTKSAAPEYRHQGKHHHKKNEKNIYRFHPGFFCDIDFWTNK